MMKAVLCFIVLLTIVSSRTITFNNLCGQPIDVQSIGTTNGILCPNLANGSSCLWTIQNAYSGQIFRKNPSGGPSGYPSATLAEFTFADSTSTGAFNYDWFDISIIPPGCAGTSKSYTECVTTTGSDGYDVGMQIIPLACVDLNRTCLTKPCDDAYGFPKDDSKTTTCTKITGDWIITFCPAGSVSDPDAFTPATCTSKRGLAYNFANMDDLNALSKGVTWFYNWHPGPISGTVLPNTVEYVPMIWGEGDLTNAAIIPTSAKYLLGFNEPNFFSQANLSPDRAAELWPQVEKIAKDRNLKLVGPAINYCGGGCWETDPFIYLDKFFAACDGCLDRMDYIAAHWYACDGPALNYYIGRLLAYGKPIWLTEFSCGDKGVQPIEVQDAYLTDALEILETNSSIFRYSWFSGRTTAISNVDLLAGSGELTALGVTYNTKSINCTFAPTPAPTPGTPSPDTTPDSPSTDDGGLSGGAIAGIVVGSIAGAVICLILAFFGFRQVKKSEDI